MWLRQCLQYFIIHIWLRFSVRRNWSLQTLSLNHPLFMFLVGNLTCKFFRAGVQNGFRCLDGHKVSLLRFLIFWLNIPSFHSQLLWRFWSVYKVVLQQWPWPISILWRICMDLSFAILIRVSNSRHYLLNQLFIPTWDSPRHTSRYNISLRKIFFSFDLIDRNSQTTIQKHW